MPEGDTVWQAARRLHTALAGQVADPLRPARAPVRHRRPHRPHRPGRHPARQAPAHPHRGRPDAPLPSADGRRLAGVRPASAGAAARPTRSARSSAPRSAPPSATASPSWNCSAPPTRTARWATSAPICWARTGTRTRRWRQLLADPARPLGEALLDQRNLAGIGNVYKCELCFLLRVTPWLPVGDLPADLAARLVALAKRAPGSQPRPPGPHHHGAARPDRRPAACTAARAAPACAAAPRSARRTRATAPASAPPTGARGRAQPGRRPAHRHPSQ